MRKNLPVFPHRRVGFADAPALFPALVHRLRACLRTRRTPNQDGGVAALTHPEGFP